MILQWKALKQLSDKLLLLKRGTIIMEKVKLGIIGIGNMGSQYVHHISIGEMPEIDLVAVADINPERLEFAKEKMPDIKTFDTGEKMIDSGLIDAVMIAVPHYDHPPLAIYAMKKGLHTMTDKPAGVHTKQVEEMNAVAKESDVCFGIMYNQRTHHIYRKMHELVHGGTLGEIRRTSWIVTDWYRPQAYYNSGSWRATWKGEGGGVLLNQCPHNLDLWQWICGMPTKVSAKMKFGKWHDIEVEDDVTAYVEYKNGATGVFITSTGDTPGSNRFEITLDKGKLVAEDNQLTLWELEESEQEFSAKNTDSFGKPAYKKTIVSTDGEHTQHTGVLNAFASAILRETPLIANGEEGINGLTISNAMHLSAWLDKEVEIPFNSELFYKKLTEQ